VGGARRTIVTLAAATVVMTGCAGSPSDAEAESSTTTAKAARSPAPERALPAALQRSLRTTLDETMTEYDVPGALVGVWVPDQGSWTSTAGLADVDSQTPVSSAMTWPLRSVTKSYTVTLLLQLVDDGELSLDDTIDEYVDGVTDGDEITLRMLANMTSGNADYTDEAFLQAYSDDPDRLFTLEDLNGFALGEPAQFAPGEEAVYTNANTNLLGAVVETVTGEPFAEVLDERILTPLDLSDTDYVLDVNAWSTPHPTGYVPTEGDVEAAPQNFSIFGPAGSMVSSLDDARDWGEALVTGALLEPETQADRLEGEPLQEGPPYDIYALGIGETNGWWGHNGEGLGFTAAVFHHPETGATIAAFMNLSNETSGAHPADQFFRRAARDLERS
jgi:D-alanyl-D-alanine carboxypeptidase